MGISSQEYRIRTGVFLSRNHITFKLKSNRSNLRRNRSFRHTRLKLLKYSTMLVLFLAFLYFPITTFCHNPKSQPSPWNFGTFSTRSSLITDHNFIARMTHGNRRKNGIKICQWNTGGGYLTSKQPELQNIVAEYTPHVLGITESAFKISQNIEDVNIPDYNLHFANTLANPGLEISRACVYVHKDIKAEVRNDLMNDSFSSVWLELGKPRQRRILVCVLYREWQYVNQPDDRTRSIPAQLERWCGFLDQWEAAISTESEIIVIGDANLDFLKWRDENITTSSHTYRLRPLVTQLFDRIIPHGFVQLVSVATRICQGQEPSGLDHFWSNYPEKLSEVEAHYRGGSDHKMIFGVRYTRSAISKPRIIRKRSYRNFNADEFIQAVKNISWWDVYTCENVEEAVKIMTSKISSILDIMAPLKSIQVCTKYAPWMSESTK